MATAPHISSTQKLLGLGGAAIGIAAGFIFAPAVPLAAVTYVLAGGAAIGAGIGIAMKARDEDGNATKKPTAQKIVDGFLGAFAGAIATTIIPTAPFAALGALIGYGAGNGAARAVTAVSDMATPAIAPVTPATAKTTPDTQAVAPACDLPTTTLRDSFAGAPGTAPNAPEASKPTPIGPARKP